MIFLCAPASVTTHIPVLLAPLVLLLAAFNLVKEKFNRVKMTTALNVHDCIMSGVIH